MKNQLVNPPAFEAMHISTATTYHFSTVPRSYGWVLATVNDETGELSIQSDWGHWSYRWSAQAGCLGAATLSHFLARRARGSMYNGKFYPDTYLADKLTSSDRKLREEFDPEGTVARLRGYVLEHRRREELTCEMARELWDDLGEILTHDDRDTYDGFATRFYDITNHDRVVSDSLSEYLRHEPTYGYLILRDCIIPALVVAIAERIAKHDDWYARAVANYAAEHA